MVRTYSRVNGWMLPPHPLQVISWLMVLLLCVSTFGILSPAFASLTVRISIHAVMGLMIFVNIAANIIVTSIDPADDAVKKKIRNHPRPGFDRDKHRHVIDENYFCNICETIIDPSSKHCRQCNKCVLDFDHHCKWLNNCIGANNYRWFMFYVISTVITSLSILALSLAVFILQFIDRESLYQADGSLVAFGVQTHDAVWLTLVALTMTLATVATFLLLHLLFFHLRIIAKGLTTYNYIMEQKKKDEEKQKHKADQAAKAAAKAAANTLASGARLFSQTTKKNPADAHGHRKLSGGGPATVNNAEMATSGGGDRGPLTRLKRFLRWRTEQQQTAMNHPNGNFSLGAGLSQHRNGLLAPDKSWKPPTKEELVMVDPSSSDVIKPDPKSADQTQRQADSRNGNAPRNQENGLLKPTAADSHRSMTPLPPIVHAPSSKSSSNAAGSQQQQPTRSQPPSAISSFIPGPTPPPSFPHQQAAQSNARKKKRAATSTQSPVPYEVMEDKENRVSVSHVAATLPAENNNGSAGASKGRNGTRGDSATRNAFSRHTDVPRLPPLPTAASAGGPNGRSAFVAATAPPTAEPAHLRNVVSTDDLAASFASTRSETLREIPLASFAQRVRHGADSSNPPSTALPTSSASSSAPPVTSTNALRTPSGSSTGSSSGSILAPLQVDALSRTAAMPTATSVAGGAAAVRYPPGFGQRMRPPLPPLMGPAGNVASSRHYHQDNDSRLSQQFSDTGSMSSGSKRVRFSGGSPILRRK